VAIKISSDYAMNLGNAFIIPFSKLQATILVGVILGVFSPENPVFGLFNRYFL
jgi:hypothetical protein